MSPQNPFTSETLIFVEGASDVCFLQSLLKKMDVTNVKVTDRDLKPDRQTPYQVDIEFSTRNGGKSNLEIAFENTLKELGISIRTQADIETQTFVAIIDGDDQTVEKNLKKFKKSIKDNKLCPVVVNLDSMHNDFITGINGIRYGCFIVKDFEENDVKDLESLLFNLAKSDVLKEQVTTFLAGINIQTFKHISKRTLLAYLIGLEQFNGNANVVLLNHLNEHFNIHIDETNKLSLLGKLESFLLKATQ
jgi:hypothetical protein